MNLQNLKSGTDTQSRTDNNNPLFGKDISDFSFRKALVFLCLLGLVIRIGFFMEHVRTPSFGVPTLDQKYYDLVARMLLAGEDLHELHGFRPLLYPLFLAVFYKLGGAWGVDLAIFVQHLLGIGTGVIVAFLGARVFQHRLCGLIGGILFLLAPVPLYFEGELLIEPSYIFLICLGLLLHIRAADSQGRKSALLWLLGGALTVLTAQARANILIFMGIYPLFAIWLWWRSRSRVALVPLLGFFGGLLMAVPWGFINMKQSDHFHLIPNAGGVALYLGNKHSADGMVPEQERRISTSERYQDSIEVWAREEYETAMRAQGRQPETDPMAISRYWTHRTIDEIKAAPGTWLRLMARKTWLTFWNAEIPNNKAFAFLQEEFIWLRILPVRWVILLMLAPAGILVATKWGNRNALFIVLVYALLYSAGNIAFFICDRYRYPVWPAMAAIGGGGLMATIQWIRLRHTKQMICVAASMVFMAALSLPNWLGVKLPNFSRDYMFRSIAWYEKGRFPEALSDVDRGLELDPGEPTALSHRGNVLFALGRLDEARDSYEQTLKRNPVEATVWSNLGSTLDAMGRTNDALAAFSHALELPTPSRNAFLGMALVQLRMGNLDGASSTLDQFDQRDRSPNIMALVIRSAVARQRGEIPQADALEQKARSLDPETTKWALERVARK